MAKNFIIKILGDNEDAKKKINEVAHALNDFTSDTGLGAGLPQKIGQFLANPLTAVAASLAGIVELLRETVAQARQIHDLAIRTGVSPRQAAAIDEASKEVGTTPEEIGAMMTRLRRAQGLAAGDPTSEMAKSLKTLGFTMDEITDSDSFTLFMRFLELMKQGGLSAEQTAAGMQIFRGNIGAMQIFARRGLGTAAEEALRSGKGPSDAEIAQGEQAARNWDAFKSKLRQGKDWVGRTLFNMLTSGGLSEAMGVAVPKANAEGLSPELPSGFKTSQQVEADNKKQQADAVDRIRARNLREAVLENKLEGMEAGQAFQKITPDKFARMGLFVTRGAQQLSNELVTLNRQSVSELKAIKQELQELKRSGGLGGEMMME